MLRVETYETAIAARIQGVGVADPTLRDEAQNFVRLKTKHAQIYSMAFTFTARDIDKTDSIQFYEFLPPPSYTSDLIAS